MHTVLFICTHNSARSILAEALLNHHGAPRFTAYSAGSAPRANQRPNPLGLQVLKEHGLPTQHLRSTYAAKVGTHSRKPIRPTLT